MIIKHIELDCLVIFLPVIMITSCVSYHVIGKTREIDQNPVEIVSQMSSTEAIITLCGVRLFGSPEVVLDSLRTIPFIEIPETGATLQDGRFSCRVVIDGYPFGMNLYYGENTEPLSVKEVIFITSNASDDICTDVLKRLTDYYGEPDIDNDNEGSYTWFPSEESWSIRLRRLHADEGGWTICLQTITRGN